MVGEPVNVRLHERRFAIEAIKFIVRRGLPAGLIKVRFGNYTWHNIKVCPLTTLPIPIAAKSHTQSPLGLLEVELRLIGAYESALRIMGALKHKLLRQLFQVNLFD